LCFPVLSWLTPAWHSPLWAVGEKLDSGNQVAVVVAFRPDGTRSSSDQRSGVAAAEETPPGSAHVPSGNRPLLSAEFRLHRVNGALAIWSAGLLLVLVRIGIDRFRLRGLRREAHSVLTEDWQTLLCELRRQLGLRRRVLLLKSPRNVMPVTWGSLRPVILLPASANEWPLERRRVVLLHELAHVKRLDCFSQLVSRIACAVYWLNPLVWVASRQMCIERERACDDLVISGGFKASQYAAHLVDIARTFPRLPRMAGIAMARSSQLKRRICSIVQTPRSRGLQPLMAIVLWGLLCGAVLAIGGNQAGVLTANDADASALLKRQLIRLQTFSNAKLKQSQDLAAAAGEKISPEFGRFFEAATTGDFQTVTNMYEDFKRRHPQYSHATNETDVHLSTPYWSPVLEICLAYDHLVRCTPKYTALLADGIINSIPPGSIYFGGTDPGRGIPTAFAKSQIDGDPFFILTQNALADGTYLEYLRQTYSGKIYTPSSEDSQKCFNDYLSDALRRLKHDQQFPLEARQIRPGENVWMENGKVEVSGQAAVMGINGLITKMIFDRNSGREFYIEESFPLEWMYPYLEPHGLILKIDREPRRELAQETVAGDRAYWESLVGGMLGDWLHQDTPVNAVADFVKKIYARKDLADFSGDRSFIENDYAKQIFSKLRSSIGGIYAWRGIHAPNPGLAKSMAAEADLAFRQAFALCPYSPEALQRYTTFLVSQGRTPDALAVAESARAVEPRNSEIQNLVQHLKDSLEAK
jgi:beta-lactamase regulating signal transducer with metallopeptidase domain